MTSRTTIGRLASLLTTKRRAAIGLALPVAVALAAAPAAEAAGPRPDFQMPVACGQMWEATTYENHWPDPDSIDLAQWSDEDANLSEGEPALASADGIVDQVFTTSGGEHRVYLDHGDGWKTHYIHLESLPPLTVGQAVAQGQQIGRIERSGADEFHLHYTQLADDEAVRVVFDGQEIATHEGDESSWGKWSTRTGEQLTSRNCPGNDFLGFSEGGKRHMLAYQPGTGAAGIVRFRADGHGVEANTWSDPIGRQWTHFTPFTHSGEWRFFKYRSSTGDVEFHQIAANGPTELSSGTWGKGWTHFMPFKLGSNSYYIAYNSLFGHVNIDRITATGTGGTTLISSVWTKGWTHLKPFVVGGVQHYLLYRASTGAYKVMKVTGSGDQVTTTTVRTGAIASGRTHVLPLVQGGAVRLMTYHASTGAATFQTLDLSAPSPGLASQAAAVTGATWTTDWTTFTPFTINGEVFIQAYKTRTGLGKVLKLDADGLGVTTVATQGWSLGLA